VGRANVVVYLDTTATQIIMIIAIKRTALSATNIASYGLAQHRIEGLAVEYRDHDTGQVLYQSA
jgi:hypothetical protein